MKEVFVKIKSNAFSFGIDALSRLALLFSVAQEDPLSNTDNELLDSTTFIIMEPELSFFDQLQFLGLEEIDNGQTVKAKFYYTDKVREAVEEKEKQEAEEQTLIEEEEARQRERYAIVEHVRQQIHNRDTVPAPTVFETAVAQAERGLAQPSMKSLGDLYEGPPKYLNQRNSPLEIPSECVKKLFDKIDISMDDRLEVYEIYEYAQKLNLPLKLETVEEMFAEAAAGRGKVSKTGGNRPLIMEEVHAAVRGRHKWNTVTKE